MSHISVVLPFYYATPMIFGSLQSLADQSSQDFDLLFFCEPELWDMHSPTLGPVMAELGLTTRVTVMPITWDPTWITHSLNEAVLLASGPIIVLWDETSTFSHPYLSCVVEDFAHHPGQNVLISGKQLCLRGEEAPYGFHVDDARGSPDRGWIRAWGTGGAILRHDWMMIGGFSEQVHGGPGSDDDFTYRLALAGFRRIIDHRMIFVHGPHPYPPPQNTEACIASGELHSGDMEYAYYSDPSRILIIR